MILCPSCGEQTPEGFPRCANCGTSLVTAEQQREQRKTVTVLFCDVTGSTALGESTDPEALRALLARYFERMKSIVESHGGTVEKFIGDAVMAVFGVPQLHEDDALRAVRAAVEMRDALPELGVQARIGVSTVEVVTGTEERLATGDAVNVAARLEQAAQPGEVLLGEAAVALVRGAIECERVEPLTLKGKAKPVAAHRLLAVTGDLQRRHEAAFVGRAGELQTLLDAWQRAQDEERCELVTVLGDPGVGKSRLAAEFLSAVDGRVVRGRCLSYGEGITYWPVVEVLKQLHALPSDPAAAAPLRSLLGDSHEATSADEIAWGFRKLLEEQAREQPLVCVLDDIQWGEETFLDLVEHVALLSTGAPILLLCLARPELLERRPQWPVFIRLEPLPETAVDALMPENLPFDLRERIARAAGGNPLFVTEMVAMARAAEGDVAVPPDLKALLAARLDGLEGPERSVLERGAVEGELFHRTAVQALSGDGQVAPRLASLVRKELLRPDQPQLPGDDAFRFRHLLIRDAAYDALPKATRAELHERFAFWLEERAADLVELDEILGYHLEQAARYKAELGQPDQALAARAGERLAAAGRRARWRTDHRAARPLIERALELIRPLRLDVHLELDPVDEEAAPEEGAANAERVAAQAREAGDRVGEALALVVCAYARGHQGEDVDDIERLAQSALPLLEDVDDHVGLGRVWHILGHGVANTRGRYDEWALAAEESVRHWRLAGEQYPLGRSGLTAALVSGSRAADEALETLDSVLPANPDPWAQARRGVLLAMLGRFEEASAIADAAGERLRELGVDDADAAWEARAEIAAFAGDHESAVRHLRRSCEGLEQQGSWALLSTYAPLLGRSLCALGRHDEAEPLAQRGCELGAADDFLTQALWRQVQALVHAHRGEYAEGERLAREAVAVAERTDGLNLQGEALRDLAEVLAAAGRSAEAANALEQALDRYERKKNLAMVGQVKPKLEELRARVS